MLLKSIKLENFRQFRNESIDFAQGEGGKNVTIIIGENGTGKTTFAQAFFWCLYGETEFSDKIILNKMVATEMTPGSEEKVRVTLALRHGEVDYTLIREQAYHKDYANNVKGDNTVFDIAIKDTSGNTSYVKKSQCEAEVKSILPKELSRYFFFDGERIEKMSKDISTGKKATDFAEAVKGLLGLNAMISAIGHFNPRSSLSVIGSYEKSFDSKSNTKIQEYTAKIDKCNARLAEIDAALEELDTQKAAAETRKSEKVIELKQYSEGKKLQKEKEDLQKQIENTTRMRATVYKTMCKDFNASMSPFFSISLIERALEVLSRHDYSGKDIPFIRDKTIEYLLKQKVCLCGTHLDEGSVTDAAGSSEDEYDDYAQRDYEAVFNRVIELDSDLKDFINAVRAIVPPQAREMDQLKYQVQEENLYARERVIQMYLRFAVRIALQRAETYDCEISDTIQEALIGLVTAVDKYDPDSSGPFGSYASLWILQNIGRAQATQRPAVYYPVHKKEGYFTMYPILKENGYLNFDIWTDPEVRRIIQDRLGCGIDQAEDIIRQSMPIESLDEIYEMFLKNIDVDEIQDDVFENIIENEIQPNVFQNINPDAFYWNDGIYEEIEQRALREILEKLMGELSEREQAVLIARYGFEDGVEKTLEEVGQTFGVTRERIRQIESKALRKLSHPTRIRELKDFL